MENTCDVLIVGGGLVGSSLACALEGAGLRVMLAEAAPPVAAALPSFDERNLALARASVNALAALGNVSEIATLLGRAKPTITSCRKRLYEKISGISGSAEELDQIIINLD